MKLNDIYTRSLKDVVEQMNLADLKVHTDNEGNVRSIELKYESDEYPHDEYPHEKKSNQTFGGRYA